MRLGELRKIQWPQVDLNAGEIRIEKKQAKNEEPRTIPIYSDMRPWIEMQKAERDQNWPSCPWVFHYLGKPIGGHIKGFVDACVKAGLPKLRAHALRRSAIRNMERAAQHRNEVFRPQNGVGLSALRYREPAGHEAGGGQDGELLGGAEIPAYKNHYSGGKA
jgi:integrase